MTSPAENPTALFCPTCTYDLRYTAEPRCPECGTPFDRSDLSVSRIPWVHRNQKSLGIFKAWRQTALLVIRPSRRLAHEVALPVDPVAASRFRWLNVLIATLLLSIFNVAVHFFQDPDALRFHINFTYDSPQLAVSRIISPVFALIDSPANLFTVPVVAFTTLAAMTWWTPFLFWITARSTPARPRAAALSHYLSAWLPIAVVVFFANPAILLALRDSLGEPSTLAIITVIVLDIFTLFTWWIANLLLYGRTTNAGLFRASLFALLHPLGTIFLFYFVSLSTLFLLGLLALIAVSLTT